MLMIQLQRKLRRKGDIGKPGEESPFGNRV